MSNLASGCTEAEYEKFSGDCTPPDNWCSECECIHQFDEFDDFGRCVINLNALMREVNDVE